MHLNIEADRLDEKRIECLPFSVISRPVDHVLSEIKSKFSDHLRKERQKLEHCQVAANTVAATKSEGEIIVVHRRIFDV